MRYLALPNLAVAGQSGQEHERQLIHGHFAANSGASEVCLGKPKNPLKRSWDRARLQVVGKVSRLAWSKFWLSFVTAMLPADVNGGAKSR
jgi:hypothetical protein